MDLGKMSASFDYIPQPHRAVALQYVGRPALAGSDQVPGLIIVYKWGNVLGEEWAEGRLEVAFGEGYTQEFTIDEISVCDHEAFKGAHPMLSAHLAADYGELLHAVGRQL